MDSKQFRDAEQASRLKTTLNTLGTEHFDQVVAISQGMINYAIKKIHEKNDTMNDFYGKSTSGSIDADLSPSQLVIPVGNEIAQDNNIVIWRTNFKNGTLKVKLNDGEKEYKMDGWSIDVKVPLSFGRLDDTAEDNDLQKAYKAKQRQWISDNFEVPGDYRPERLYAKMASGRWADITFAGSSFLVDGELKLYEDWKRQGDNSTIAEELEKIFKAVSLKREDSGMTTIGTRFKMDAAKISDNPATYPPVTMIHQTFPYKIGSESGKIGWDEGVQGIPDPGSRNCLLYCENINNRKMTGKQVPQTGNFATIGSPNYPGSRVEGSFVLSYQLFFEKFLLPHLQAFVMEAQIYPKPDKFWVDGDGNEMFDSSYDCGKNPSKDPNRNPSNEIYKFRPVLASGSVDAHYEAYVEINAELPLHHFEAQGEYAKYWAEGSPHVTVKWKKAGNRITVCGVTNYNRNITNAEHQNVDSNSHQLSPATSWQRERFKLTWELHIDVTVKDGGLDLSLTHDKESFVKVENNSETPKGWHHIDPETPKNIVSYINRNMKDRIEHLEEVLKHGFSHQFKFIYPGNGQLSFKNNMFNDKGDLIAEIKYQDTAGSDKIVIPPPKKLPDAPNNNSGTVDGGGSKPKPKLEWTATTPVKASSSPTEIKITGKNATSSTVYFSKIQAKYTGFTLGDELFKSIKFVTANGKTDEVEISVKTESASAMSTPALNPHKLSSKKYECTATYEAATSPIAIQAGGSIHLIAKGETGNAGADTETTVTELWSDKAGKTPDGINTYKGVVKVKLS